MGGEMGGRAWRALLGISTALVLVWLLSVGILTGRGTTSTSGALATIESIKHSDSPVYPSTGLDPNSMSKRRVPNGPDPIHNRRAGKSKQPPGRA